MKNIFKIISVLTLFIFISCQKEIDQDTITQDNNNPTKNLTKQSITNLEKLILNNTSSIQYPITVLTFFPDAQQTGSNTFENNQDLFNFINNLTDDNILITLKYPISFLNENLDEIVLNNNEELITETKEIIVPDTNDYLDLILLKELRTSLIKNLVVQYPVKLITGAKNVFEDKLEIGSFTVNNSDNFLSLLPRDLTTKLVSINYPITIFDKLQKEFIINSNAELLIKLSKQLSENSEFLETVLLDKFISYLNNETGIVYPIKAVYSTKNQNNSELLTIESKAQFFNIIDLNNLNNVILTLKYPLQINNTTINSNQELNTFLNFDIEITDRLKYISRYDGRFDDAIDNSPSSSIEYPYQVILGNNTISINNISDYLEVLQEKENQNIQEISIVFPIFTKQFHVINGVRNQSTFDELVTIFKDVTANESRAKFSSYAVKYPIEVKTKLQNSFISINDDKALTLLADDIIEINYPIELINSNNEITTINNNQELISTIESK